MLKPATAEEKAILEQNKALRRTRHTGTAFGGMELEIPYRHLKAIQGMIPAMRDNHPDKEEHRRAWRLFLSDSLSKRYRVR